MNAPTRRWGRWLLAGAGILIGACVLNAAVSVACALWSPTGPQLSVTSSEHRGWPASVPEDWPAMDSFRRWSGFGLDHDDVSMSRLVFDSLFGFSGEGTMESYEAARVRSGWPWRSFVSTRIAHTSYEGDVTKAPTAAPQAPWRRGMVVDADWTAASPDPRFGRIVPFQLLLRGFALNSMVYAGCLLVFMGVHRLVRGRWRRARGRCACCGYDRRGLQTCPECGSGSNSADGPADTLSDHGQAPQPAQNA